MKKIVDNIFAFAVTGVILLLLACALSACGMLKFWVNAEKRDAEDFIKIAGNNLKLELNIPSSAALPNDRKIVQYISGDTSPEIEGFHFISSDVRSIAQELSADEASFDIKQDLRDIQYIFAGTLSGDKPAFVAAELYPHPFLSGLAWTSFGVILVSLALTAALLGYIYRAVTLHIARIYYKLPDLAACTKSDGKSLEKGLKEHFRAGSYPLAQLNTLVDRLCAILSNYVKMRRRFGEKLDANCKTVLKSEIESIEKGETASGTPPAIKPGRSVRAQTAAVWVLSLLLVCLLFSIAMLGVFFRTAEHNSKNFIKAARDNLKLELNIPLSTAVSSDDRNGDKPAFVAAELYPHPILSGLAWAWTSFGVILASLALTAGILCGMYRAVKSCIERIHGKLSQPGFFEVDLSDGSAGDKLKELREYLGAGTYPLRQLNLLIERLCPVIVSYFEMRGQLGRGMDDDEKHNMESVMRFREEGQIMAAEYTRLSHRHKERLAFKIDCKLEDFDVIGETKQAKMANLLEQAVKTALRRGASQITVHLRDGENGAIVFEAGDNGVGDVSETEKTDMLALEERGFIIEAGWGTNAARRLFKVTLP